MTAFFALIFGLVCLVACTAAIAAKRALVGGC